MNIRLHLVSDRTGTDVREASPQSAALDDPAAPIPFAPPRRRAPGRLRGLRQRVRELIAEVRRDDEGAVTAEYAVVIIAAIAFAGILVAILSSSEVRGMLLDLVRNALATAE